MELPSLTPSPGVAEAAERHVLGHDLRGVGRSHLGVGGAVAVMPTAYRL